MKLWIRSQDKSFLSTTTSFGIFENGNGSFDISYGFTNYGNYKTKERALEVLDEIQNFMLCNREYGYTADVYINELANCYIYEMPKE